MCALSLRFKCGHMSTSIALFEKQYSSISRERAKPLVQERKLKVKSVAPSVGTKVNSALDRNLMLKVAV